MWKFIHSVFVFCVCFSSIKAQSRCTTPNGEAASCISIYNCPVLYDAVTTKNPQIVNFLRQSQCGYNNGPLVCCGSYADFVNNDNTDNTVTRQPIRDSGSSNEGLLPTSRVCGFQLEDKILNGETAGLEEFPWMALLKYRNSSGHETFSCGGTLISDRYVVTAAHCITGKITQSVGRLTSVRLGEWNTETERDCTSIRGFSSCSDPPVNVGVEEAIAHSQYDDSARDRLHDIGIIRLDRPVKFTNYVIPVCLPSTSDTVSIGERLTVVGWGRTETGRFSPTKQKLAVPVVDANQCRATFRRSNVNIRDTQLCAGGERDKDSCNGDSGGPLLRSKGNDHQFFIEGIVSFGAKCGTAGWPGIYTKVAAYRNWILSNLRA